MGFFGNLLGQGAGWLGEKLLPIPGVNGRVFGGAMGDMLPFKKGGCVYKNRLRALAGCKKPKRKIQKRKK